MYVHPFLMGVICTVLVEIAGVIALLIWSNKKR
jgi:hypothetical protein